MALKDKVDTEVDDLDLDGDGDQEVDTFCACISERRWQFCKQTLCNMNP